MKRKKEDRIIRELFRQKLDNIEIIPGPSVRKQLMQNVARKEFLRFNPGRFNVYYLGGILVAGLIAALIAISGDNDPAESVLLIPSSEFNDTTSLASTLKDHTFYHRSSNQNKTPDRIIDSDKEGVLISDRESSDNKITGYDLHSGNIIKRPELADNLTQKRILSESLVDKNNLQYPSKSENEIIDASIKSGCVPLKVRFSCKNGSWDSYHWSFGDGGSSVEKEPDWIFDFEGEYKVVLNVTRQDGTKRSSSIQIKVNPKPLARFEIMPENPLLPDDDIRFNNYSTDAIKYLWEFGDGNKSEMFEPKHKYRVPGNYNVRLVVTSAFGCSDSLVVYNALTPSGYYVNFPNAFIPNPGGPTGGYYSSSSDESANIFHPYLFGISEYHLRIFSKRGLLIFESRDINIGWDGYYNGQLCEQGVYIWKVRGKYINGETFTKMGDLTLLRSIQ